MAQITPAQIERWVARHFKYKKRSYGKQLVINNPFDGDNGYHFWISLERRKSKKHPDRINYWAHDFRPGHKSHDGSFIDFVKKYKRIDYFQAMAEVVGGVATLRDQMRQAAREVGEIEEEEEEERELDLPPASRSFTEGTETLAFRAAVNYLRSRRVSLEMALDYKLYYTPSSIVFPYYEFGLMVYWQERSILEKAFNFPDQSKTGKAKTDYLYNYDNVEQPDGTVAIVESIFNTISIGDDCVASGGATIAGNQIKRIRALRPKMVILAPDNDKAGIESLKDNFYLLKNDFKLAYCIPPGTIKDWNDMDQAHGRGAAREFFEANIRLLTFPTIVQLLSRYR